MPPMKTSRSRKGRESRRKRIQGSSIRSGGERLSLPRSGPRPRRARRGRFGRLEPAGSPACPRYDTPGTGPASPARRGRRSRGSGGLSLLGRERGQEAFEFLGEEPGRGSALGELPEIQVFEDVFDDTRLFDHRDHLESVTALGTRQRVNLLERLASTKPPAPHRFSNEPWICFPFVHSVPSTDTLDS